ncbi:MAG: hypothetical protein J2P47_10150 [Acetobacteraceae bacterium]|nr:hypothetical protein [Acetobacteraceae bacterium]
MTHPAWIAAMRRGDFRTAHAISDQVLAGRDPAHADDPRQPYHLRWVWDGRDLRGRDVLVRCYHGLGDTIQFARYLAELRSLCASVTVEIQPALLDLIATMRHGCQLIPFRPAAPAAPRERTIEIMELAHALRRDAQGERVPYLRVNEQQQQTRDALAVGLCWRAGDWDTARSIPPERLRAACALPAVQLGSLQYGVASDAHGLPALLTRGADAITTARIIMGLDLVITVDTMIAHLAGALGRETWLLLKRDCDWRWMAGRTETPWYPTMRLYRQAGADWQTPLAGLRRDLALRARAAGC